jgi:REP element-mobilizing transposase RayT
MKTGYDPRIHHRCSICLKEYDYSRAGMYFITLVTQGRAALFGEVVEGEMRLNNFGVIVAATWEWLETQYPYVELGTWIIMPKHFHGILILRDDPGCGGSRTAPTDFKRKTLGRLIGVFKTVSTKQINLHRTTQVSLIWQRDFYEHIIRNQQDLERIWLYIQSNPCHWHRDGENPAGR